MFNTASVYEPQGWQLDKLKLFCISQEKKTKMDKSLNHLKTPQIYIVIHWRDPDPQIGSALDFFWC